MYSAVDGTATTRRYWRRTDGRRRWRLLTNYYRYHYTFVRRGRRWWCWWTGKDKTPAFLPGGDRRLIDDLREAPATDKSSHRAMVPCR